MTDPGFPVTDDGFRDALHRSRRRRHRRRVAAASASGGVLTLVAGLALVASPVSPDSLRQPEPFGPAVQPTADRDGGQSASPVASSRPGNRVSPVPGARAASPALAQPPTSGALSTSPPSQQVGPPQPAPPISGTAVLTSTTYRSTTPCADTSGRATAGWCLQPGEAFEGVSGEPADLAVSLCRLPGFPAARATFPSSAEAGFALHREQGGGGVWEHARQHPGRPERHSRAVEPGTCLTWTATWWNRDDAGRDVPPGGYELRLSVLAEDVGGQDVLTQTYRYDVRER
jgi:hypothetical protein